MIIFVKKIAYRLSKLLPTQNNHYTPTERSVQVVLITVDCSFNCS